MALVQPGFLPPAARAPAIVPLTQLPPQIARTGSADPAAAAAVAAGEFLAAFINDSAQVLPASRAIVFYAGGAECG